MSDLTDAAVDTAVGNYSAQVELLEQIRDATTVPLDVIAERLGVTEPVARAYLAGSFDMTLTELRYLANAAELLVTYEVTSPTDPDDGGDR
ncbi:hypothetical protein [Leifsonia sp. Leaf264]|uniref:hypothetical protein n=1 Tax=Leifsonia sp. Leaf264 TaxID=1736314 RepID=UPI0006F7C68D|nr:hypothetical protein [Leifsonia sp. Leaf264]KQO98396.1 hypothetical protein ASF30_10065 [Leifsonia sp. Leaf264]